MNSQKIKAALPTGHGIRHACAQDLVSRPAADVLVEAEKLVGAGVKELLVISQDTGAYGLDLKYAESAFREHSVPAKFIDLARELGTLGV